MAEVRKVSAGLPMRTAWLKPLSATGIQIVMIWTLSRVPGLTGFVLAQHAQGQPAGWAQLAARWDGEWYVMLARNGYPPTLDLPGRPHYGPWGFFPFWPWSIRLISTAIGDHPGVAAAIMTALYGLAAIVAVWAAAHLIGGRSVALGATLLFAFFPRWGCREKSPMRAGSTRTG